jgi:cobalt-zinc-cadmium efflux system membrane fusion protein
MKNINKINVLVFISFTSLYACNNSSSATNEAQAEAPATTSNLVTLTNEEAQNIGLMVGRLEVRNIATSSKVNGLVNVMNPNKALATPQFGGIVQAVQVRNGSTVSKGAVIATISNPEFISLQEEYLNVQAQLMAGDADAVASVSNAQYAGLQEQYNVLAPQIDLAEKEVKRQKELQTGNAGSLKNLQQAESNLSTLLARRDLLRQQLALFSKNANISLKTKRAALESKLLLMGIEPSTVSAEKLQNTLAVRSPIAGKVSEIHAKIGAYVDASNPIAEIIDLGQMNLKLNVYEKDIPAVSIGQAFRFSPISNPTASYTAKVYALGTSLDNAAKTLEAYATIEGNKTGLVEGMNVVADVGASKSEVFAVPNGALVSEEGQYFIFIEKNNTQNGHVFEKTSIKTGAANASFTEVIFPTPPQVGIRIATAQAFFLLGKMTNTGEE